MSVQTKFVQDARSRKRLRPSRRSHHVTLRPLESTSLPKRAAFALYDLLYAFPTRTYSDTLGTSQCLR